MQLKYALNSEHNIGDLIDTSFIHPHPQVLLSEKERKSSQSTVSKPALDVLWLIRRPIRARYSMVEALSPFLLSANGTNLPCCGQLWSLLFVMLVIKTWFIDVQYKERHFSYNINVIMLKFSQKSLKELQNKFRKIQYWHLRELRSRGPERMNPESVILMGKIKKKSFLIKSGKIENWPQDLWHIESTSWKLNQF